MSNQTCKIKLQKLGEDTAYTFKGLYKTADSLDFLYNILLTIPIILSILYLGFEANLPYWIMKIVSCLSLIAVFILLFKKNDFSGSKIEKYRKVANEYKEIYDEIECYYHDCDEKEDIEKINSIMSRVSGLRQKTVELPINFLGRFLSKRKINVEMDLGWIYSGKK